MQDHIFELQRMIWRYDWSSQLHTQFKQLKNLSVKKTDMEIDLHIILHQVRRRSNIWFSIYSDLYSSPYCIWLDSSVGRALHRYRAEVKDWNPVHSGVNFFSGFNFPTAQVVWITTIINHIFIVSRVIYRSWLAHFQATLRLYLKTNLSVKLFVWKWLRFTSNTYSLSDSFGHRDKRQPENDFLLIQ